MSLENKIALVTGAASGIGKETGIKMLEKGAKVIISDVDEEKLMKTKYELEKYGELIAIPTNVAVYNDVKSLVNKSINIFEKIDILINCAGIRQKQKPFTEISEEEWDQIFKVNVKGVLFMSQLITPKMKENKYGRIVNISSIAGKIPRVGYAAYCCSKASVIALTKVMALEVAKYNITVNAVCPGATITGMFEQAQKDDGSSIANIKLNGSLEQYRLGVPLGRLAKPSDQAEAICFLASDAAEHITGQTLFVDGGESVV